MAAPRSDLGHYRRILKLNQPILILGQFFTIRILFPLGMELGVEEFSHDSRSVVRFQVRVLLSKLQQYSAEVVESDGFSAVGCTLAEHDSEFNLLELGLTQA